MKTRHFFKSVLYRAANLEYIGSIYTLIEYISFLLNAYSREVCPAYLAKEGSKKQQCDLENQKF